jgi:hypothetical protein
MFKLIHLHKYKIMFFPWFVHHWTSFFITTVHDATITKLHKKTLNYFLFYFLMFEKYKCYLNFFKTNCLGILLLLLLLFIVP